ncbi:MAG: preprotein translocase subunit SecG [Cryomorphaceae bacterium]|nr:MAG: preprotein translocase subunit SecG [Cryomorphaceae bacterium]
MSVFIGVLIILVCVFLVLVILVQNPKGGGLSSEFGSANQIGGVRKTADFLEKATWGLAIALVVLSLAAAAVQDSASSRQFIDEPVPTQQPAPEE